MKKLFLLLFAALFMFSCGGSGNDNTTERSDSGDSTVDEDGNTADIGSDAAVTDDDADTGNGSDDEDNTDTGSGGNDDSDSDEDDTDSGENDDSDSDENDTDSGDSGSDDGDSGDSGDTDTEAHGVSTVGWNGKTGTVSVSGDDLRTYTLKTNADLRWEQEGVNSNEEDNRNDYLNVCGRPLGSKECVVSEKADKPVLRSGNSMLDALFTLAITELDANKVSTISDWNMGTAQCDCFETGANWHYVWTRDTAYAIHSGIAFLEPERSKNSLRFKISERKDAVGGGNLQIVQDTGSGGSWPISTDRVAWTLGAFETLKNLQGAEYEAFLAESYEAIKNTLDADRLYVFDEKDGLYRGEQSFLDWREQTYPLWTAQNTKHIGMSKTLSTNILHYIAMNMAAILAEALNKNSDAQELRRESWELIQAIKSAFYIDRPDLNKRTFASMKTTFLDESAVDKRDLLGLSLLILGTDAASIADGDENLGKDIFSAILEEYPVTEAGPSVIFPQEPQRGIYHNRAIWPFVTSYALRAAAKVENDRFYENAFMSMIRGAALNLSNMENLEFMTLDAWHEDTWPDFNDSPMSGPVVNSRRQLWSVGGFISLVLDAIFGREQTLEKICFSPAIPVNLRNTFFADSSEIVLKNLKFKGEALELRIKLPEKNSGTEGFYVLDSLKLNGEFKEEGACLPAYGFAPDSIIEMELKLSDKSGKNVNLIDDCTVPGKCWAPRAVEKVSVKESGRNLSVEFTAFEDAVSYNVYRDGKQIGWELTEDSGEVTVVETVNNVKKISWRDTYSSNFWNESFCYSVAAVNAFGWESHHSDPVCYWGNKNNGDDRTKMEFSAGANAFDQRPNITDSNSDLYHGRVHFGDWGKPDEVLSVSNIKPEKSGTYLVSVEYGSGRPIDTGITSCNKIIKITDESNNVVMEKMVFMPHLGRDDWDRWGESSFASVELTNGKSYKAEIRDAFNMSYFKHFVPFTGAGGGTDIYNRANISTIKFLLKEIK